MKFICKVNKELDKNNLYSAFRLIQTIENENEDKIIGYHYQHIATVKISDFLTQINTPSLNLQQVILILWKMIY